MGKLIIMNCTIGLLSSTEKGNNQLKDYRSLEDKKGYSIIKKV